MNSIIEQIEKIKQINANNNLVVFVGAGVSQNSGVCSWAQLVKGIADKIGENKCSTCELKEAKCREEEKKGNDNRICFCRDNGKDCKLKYSFASDDYLRIPQHYYDGLENKEEYNAYLKQQFDKNYQPNEIDRIIIQLQPEHIITTNYDHLLEDVNDPEVSRYSVIVNDDDLLAKTGRNYIIKMHGDVDDIDNIVLKEDDYLNYSQKHIIIETFIKSLLIDKTFLFVGYSLNDNNLKLIMSYIDFFVKEKKVENRQPHYLVVDSVKDPQHDYTYWRNKGVELIDLSSISEYMIGKADCIGLKEQVAKKLYTLLYYIKNEGVPYTDDSGQELTFSVKKLIESVSCFGYISYRTILKVFRFETVTDMITPFMVFGGLKEYENFRILTHNKELRSLLVKAGICGIRSRNCQEKFDEDMLEDRLYKLSLLNKYDDIMKELSNHNIDNEYIYYFSLVNHTKGLEHILDKLVEKYSKIDYKNLEAKGYYDLAVFEFNNTCIKYLLYLPNGKGNLDFVLERAAALFSDAYNSIKEMSNKNADIQRMNEILYKHEEYYMKKEQISKLGGTEYGDLYKIRQMAYDYYQFYKKNHLMLEWIPNVTKYVTPYVNAIFCTYYPDRFQGDYFGAFPRTNVVPYPLTLLDIDMIVKHISVKELKSIIWKYKVEYIFIDTNVDVAELFENFCVSMKKYFVIKRIDQLESFSLLLSLCRLNLEQNREITTAFLRLMTPNKSENINAVTNCIKALSVYAASHFDSGIPEYYNLLELLINKDVFSDAMFKSKKEFVELIARLSSPNDKLYDKIWTEYNKLAVGEDKALWAYTFRKILTSINCEKWKSVMQDNLEYLQEGEIFQCLLEKELEFDATIKKHYMNIMSQRMIPGITTFPNHRENAIEYVVLSVILGIVTVEDISFMKDYVQESDYLEFIFSPNSFDYSKIKVSDAIWCDFIQNEIFRDLILKHKDMFWNKEEIKRIDLGFGSSFENRIVYKYLYD